MRLAFEIALAIGAFWLGRLTKRSGPFLTAEQIEAIRRELK